MINNLKTHRFSEKCLENFIKTKINQQELVDHSMAEDYISPSFDMDCVKAQE